MKKKYLIIILLLVSSLSYAQTTYFHGSKKVESKKNTASLYSVEIDRERGLTFVTIELIPTRKMSRLTYQSSYNTKIKIGTWEGEFLGALSNDGKSTHSCDCSDNWGWSKPTIGMKYRYTLVFAGVPPYGYTSFALEDKGSYSGCSGYKFWNYTIKNPDTHPKTNWTEYSLKSHWKSKGADPIEGIYENAVKTENSPKYKLGLIKSDKGYTLIYLSGAENPVWKLGDVKAYLTKTAIPSLFKVKYYMGNKTINEDLYIGFESGLMKVIWTDSQENLYFKLYPTSEDNITTFSGVKSSGTGFAISSNGYIVTNHHVIENAKSVEVKGVNGNFSKKLSAEVVVSDEKNDLAIIKINDPGFTTLGTIPYTFRQGIADVGESVFVLGYPMTSSMGEEIKLTNGIISSKTGFKGDISAYQVSVPVQPGNSGGPLFDKNGNILGVVNAKHSLAENASYAIKVNYLKNLIELLPQTINQPTLNALNGKGLTDQVKIASNFTYLIVVNDKGISYSSSSNSSSSPKKSATSEQNAAVYYEKAQELWKNNDPRGALEQINLSIEASPNYAGSFYFRGFIYLYGIKNFDKAIEDFTKSIQMQTDFEGAYFFRGMAYHELEKNIEAIKDFSKVISMNKENTDAYFMRALIKSSMNDRQGAISDYDEILKREKTAKPTFYKMSTVYNNKAYCLVEMDKASEALPLVSKALELDKSEAYIWDTRGEIYFKLAEYEKCIKDMDKAISIEESENSYYIRGLAKIKLGKKIEGCKDLSKAGELGKTEAYKAISENCK